MQSTEQVVSGGGSKHSVQVDSVGVQVHADDVWRGVVKVEVAGVHAHYKWTRGVEDAR